MNRETPQVVRVIVWTLIVCTAPGLAMADYAIESYTIEDNATTSSGGGFVLTGTIEQPDPNVADMTGGTFALAGGLQPGIIDANDPLPIVMDPDDEAGATSQCGSGIDQALPLLMVFGPLALLAIPRRLRRPRRHPREPARTTAGIRSDAQLGRIALGEADVQARPHQSTDRFIRRRLSSESKGKYGLGVEREEG